MSRRLRIVCLTHAAAGFAASLLLASPARAIGPSYDCSASITPFQKIICDSPELSAIELDYVRVYFALQRQAGVRGVSIVQREAQDFRTAMMQLCGVTPAGDLTNDDKPDRAACIAGEFKRQANEFRTRLQGEAMAEAMRPLEQFVLLQKRLNNIKPLPPSELQFGIYGPATRYAIMGMQLAADEHTTGFLSNADVDRLLGIGKPAKHQEQPDYITAERPAAPAAPAAPVTAPDANVPTITGTLAEDGTPASCFEPQRDSARLYCQFFWFDGLGDHSRDALRLAAADAIGLCPRGMHSHAIGVGSGAAKRLLEHASDAEKQNTPDKVVAQNCARLVNAELD